MPGSRFEDPVFVAIELASSGKNPSASPAHFHPQKARCPVPFADEMLSENDLSRLIGLISDANPAEPLTSVRAVQGNLGSKGHP